MVFEILKGSTEPKVCIIFPGEPHSFEVSCDLRPELVRKASQMEKVCLVEFDKGKPYSMCDKGSEIVAKIAMYKRA